MKKRIFLALGCSLLIVATYAQKPALDTGVLYHWPSVYEHGILSVDGNYAGYLVVKGFSDEPIYYLKGTYSSWEKKLPGVKKVDFTNNSRSAIYLAGETLHILILGSNREDTLPQISSYQLFKRSGEEYLLCYSKTEKRIIIRNKENRDSYSNVDAWQLSADGQVLLTKVMLDKGKVRISRIGLNTKEQKVIGEGGGVSGWIMDDSGEQIAFSTKDQNGENQIWHYRTGEDKATVIATNHSKGIDQGLTIGNLQRFSKDGSRLLFNLRKLEKAKPNPNMVPVDVWSYRDAKLQSPQLQERTPEQNYLSVIRLKKEFSILRLQQDGETPAQISPDGNYMLFNLMQEDVGEYSWSKESQFQYDLVNTQTGKRVMIKYRVFGFSSGGRFLEMQDIENGNISTYELSTGIIRPLTAKVAVADHTINDEAADINKRFAIPISWLPGDSAILVQDYYDLWELDALGKKVPINLTHFEGARTKTTFNLATGYPPGGLLRADTLIINAFNHETKENGFCRIVLHKEQVPENFAMESYCYYAQWSGLGKPLVKATDANIYLVNRESISESPNYFVTKDFKSFQPISNVYPERDYNWTRSKLINFKTTDGRNEQGVLYLPEDFDSGKKYPLIFHYYERKSDQLNEYREPNGHPGDLNIPWFTSHGYLVFIPDFHYELGKTGERVLQTVEGAVKLLKTFPYVDSKHMGLQGHSYGGGETNFLVTHSHEFAAAISSAGITDIVSEYGNLWFGESSKQGSIEIGQERMGGSLWETPDYYIKNSAIFYTDKVTTPLMIVANKLDGNVPFTQGLELFTALRRLGKKAWMLQYDRESHGEFHKPERIDYLLRSTQFFDHYLKGAPAPKWMVEGIPATKKQIDNGFELEPAGVEPGPGLLTPEAQKKVDALRHKKPITIPFTNKR